MERFQSVLLMMIFAALCGLAAYVFRVNKQRVLQYVADLINRAEEAVEGSGMGAEKKALVIAQLEAAGIRVTAWLDKQIDFMVAVFNAQGAWLAKKTQEVICGQDDDPLSVVKKHVESNG